MLLIISIKFSIQLKIFDIMDCMHKKFNIVNICVVFMLFDKLNLMQVSRGNILKATGMLCNPNFIHKNNWCFSLSSIYFLYPLTSLPKMVKSEMPASIEQSKLFVLVTMCWSPLSPKINKRGMLAKLCLMLRGKHIEKQCAVR